MFARRVALGLVGAPFLLLAFLGNRACEENYCLACGISTGTTTATPTPDDDDDDNGATATSTSTPTRTTTPGASVTATSTPTVTTTVGVAALGAAQVKALRDLAVVTPAPQVLPAPSAQGGGAQGGNWLGRAFLDEDEAPIDSDGDGFVDRLEEAQGSDLSDPLSFPGSLTSVLKERVLGVEDLVSRFQTGRDQDGDRLSDQLEVELGSNPLDADTDRDGVLDGAEVRLGSDPTLPEAW